jgi:hypothetical protein
MSNHSMKDWLLCRVDPEVFAAVEAAAADAWTQHSDYVRVAVISRLRAEGRLPPRPTRRATKEIMPAR